MGLKHVTCSKDALRRQEIDKKVSEIFKLYFKVTFINYTYIVKGVTTVPEVDHHKLHLLAHCCC